MTTTSRERIVDAYAEALAVDGERHATLEAVAARAGVSKGGLLYHFPSKDQLAEALCDRLVALAAADIEEMRNSPDGPARHYIRTSHYADTSLDRTLIAVARLQQAGDPRASAAIELISDQWLSVLHDALGDRDIARTVKLIGDGLYHNALFSALGGRRARAELDEGLLAVIDRLIDQCVDARQP
ncbi:TetR/AcrR family transcriptional regulator [Mycolicibacterium sp. CH28]|uniref:TetR/AcrR family transcriptional regulator n=1 Tax=Mycolicibacterium sp. CH28 TaxID=2512237 RepID=UPI0010821903|nr:TetR/AcrR family transcriptional regulator [Mycolicibacterium sp. CH28]TGD84305.1 TetR/AcrR family transcriptional regulator [Mycolicibacterium sp. CH28]